MVLHSDTDKKEVLNMIRKGEIVLGGNKRLKIYGTLGCASGKRMKRENRVFFKSDTEARKMGFRPCGHCMKEAYKQWKDGFVQL
ncbi:MULTISPECIES: Ada metal-binding domain-containing protein [Flagellimonas]|uniref:Metal-binding protein n=1 Tax=Flagellimonas hadalis TaxID=2597517 RepID=A0A5N5IX64_9FLAO|nr:Ada metal-binding domain-containing protein [Allomuricauda hadalis]KAB5492109.1 metal-binding protein [Allomuricauda hadalis]